MVDLSNKRFGRPIVVHRDGANKWGEALWFCKCGCGGTKIIIGKSLCYGSTRSCECSLREETHWTHGFAQKWKEHELYDVWKVMIQICTNPNRKDYHNYGGRGITVCFRWKKFEHFLTDMGERPSKCYSIDRIDNDRGYCKSNCRWATKKQQARNSRRW